MKEILEEVEKDKLAGVHRRADGKFYFVQRKVRFCTIDFKEEYIFSRSWGIFQNPLDPVDWNRDPYELDKILTGFSKECSRRFHYLWYKYIDVMVARSLSLNDKNLFRKDFIKPSVFLDLGISENREWTNVPGYLQEKILGEYRTSLSFRRKFRIFYLTEYLLDLNADIIRYLKPYHKLWDLEEEKHRHYQYYRKFINDLYENSFLKFLIRTLNEFTGRLLININVLITSKLVAELHYRLKQTGVFDLSYFERKIILDFLFSGNFLKENFKFLYLLNEYTAFPGEVENYLRKLFSLENLIHREKIHNLRNLYQRNSSGDIFDDILNSAVSPRENELVTEKIDVFYRLMEFLYLPHNLILNHFLDLYEGQKIKGLMDFFHAFEELKNKNDAFRDTVQKEILSLVRKYSQLNYEIFKFYREGIESPVRIFEENPKYRSVLEVPKNLAPGNPFHERALLEFGKALIQERLKPIRMAANDYSLLYNERHGILTLNPVLKLWKSQVQFRDDLPEIVQLEINTPVTVETLLELVILVDKKLPEREIQRGQILKDVKGKENLENMTFLILPGSCYPIKEVPASHFPEFQKKIIGEKRNFNEVGIDETHYILTGAWYNKNNHTLYYPVGGDNAELLKRIYLGIRTNIVPAFFFAIGQFVFECLPDTVLYYKTTKKTFREILLKIHQQKAKKLREMGKEPSKLPLLSKEEIRFQFAIYYSLLIMENLTGGLHIHSSVPELYRWFLENLGIESVFQKDKEHRRQIRIQAQRIIEEYDRKWKSLKSQSFNIA